MKKYLVFKLDNNEIVGMYEAPEEKIFGGPWGDPENFGQLEIPLNINCPKVINDGKDFIITEDIESEEYKNLYKQKRKMAYPSIGDQLDALYKKLALGQETEWNEISHKIYQVKTQFPKPE